jgi:hypothetical protein
VSEQDIRISEKAQRLTTGYWLLATAAQPPQTPKSGANPPVLAK